MPLRRGTAKDLEALGLAPGMVDCTISLLSDGAAEQRSIPATENMSEDPEFDDEGTVPPCSEKLSVRQQIK